jgi:D-amino-acid dehydrogenase
MQADVIVLGAGIVGVSVAVHLAQRGLAVVLVDRRAPGEETSYGNAGLIQREGVLPHAFPQALGKVLHYGLNTSTDMAYHPAAIPGLTPFLARYWWHSRPSNYRRITHLYEPLIAHSVSEHAKLIEAAGADALVARNGWFKLFRTRAALEAAFAEADMMKAEFGVNHEKLDDSGMHAAEPALTATLAGAIHWTDPWAIKDPRALTAAYVELFERLGGQVVKADAAGFAAAPGGAGWRMASAQGPLEAGKAVVALGPWSDLVTRRLGYRLPLAVKRGYHMHYRPVPGHAPTQWMLDAEPGYLLAPMNQGIRLTTGAEFAPRDAPPTPIQIGRAERIARELLPLGERIDPVPWMGARPATPDMMPIIGPAPRHEGLWFAFGHAHHGLTLGPATGRLIADLVTGAAPYIDPAPYSALRFNP